MFRSGSLSLEQALQKVRHYCGYQERCHSEVKEKLYSFGLRKNDVEAALATLVEENYLNEERFATQFAGGRFRLKEWGKVRIKYQLKQRQVSEYCIRAALAAIDGEEYERTLGRLAAEKWMALRGEENIFIRKRKLQDYLTQKGYEPERVTAAVQTVDKTSE